MSSISPANHFPYTRSIYGLPNELTITILVFAIKQQPSVEDQQSFLLTIQLVCRKWRDIALSAHELWTSVSIRTSDVMPPNAEYLKKSDSRRWDIHLEADTDGLGWLDPTALVWRRFLDRNIRRIQSLHITTSISSGETLGRILNDLPNRFINLLEFSATQNNSDEWGNLRTTIWPRNLVLPHLRSLRLTDLALESWAPLATSCANLLELYITNSLPRRADPSSTDILTVLRSSPNLQILELDNDQEGSDVGLEPVMMEHLHSLTVWNPEKGDFRTFFNLFNAPRLRNLTINGALCDDEDPCNVSGNRFVPYNA